LVFTEKILEDSHPGGSQPHGDRALGTRDLYRVFATCRTPRPDATRLQNAFALPTARDRSAQGCRSADYDCAPNPKRGGQRPRGRPAATRDVLATCRTPTPGRHTTADRIRSSDRSWPRRTECTSMSKALTTTARRIATRWPAPTWAPCRHARRVRDLQNAHARTPHDCGTHALFQPLV